MFKQGIPDAIGQCNENVGILCTWSETVVKRVRWTCSSKEVGIALAWQIGRTTDCGEHSRSYRRVLHR